MLARVYIGCHRSGGASLPARLRRELRPGRRPEPEIAQHLELLLRREPQAELGHRDVAGGADRLGQGDIALVDVHVPDRLESSGRFESPACSTRRRSPNTSSVLSTRSVLKQRGGGEELGRGPRLERIGEGGGSGHRAGTDLPGGEREQLAGLRIQEDDVPAFRLHLLQRIGQPALGDLLKLRVDGEHDVVAGHRVAHQARRASRSGVPPGPSAAPPPRACR